MLQTLFTIPETIGGVPLFGVGILLAIWLLFSSVWMIVLVRKEGWTRETLSYLPVALLVAIGIVFVPRIFPGGLPIRGYGMMMLLGVVSGVLFAAHRAGQMGIQTDLIFSLAFWLFLFGIAGARLFHVLEYWEPFYHKETVGETIGAILNVPQGGLVVYGSLIGGIVAFAIFVYRHHLPALALADLIVPSLMLGLAFGRLGCFLNGCCFGGQCDYPWAVRFPEGSPPYQSQIERGGMYGFSLLNDPAGEPRIVSVQPDSPAAKAGLRAGMRIEAINRQQTETAAQAMNQLYLAYQQRKSLQIETGDNLRIAIAATEPPDRSQAIHPAQLYSAINAALLFLFLAAYYPFRRRDGEVCAVFLSIYPVSRFLLEIIRTDESSVWGTGFSISQNVSLLLLVGTIGLWLYILRKPKGSVLPPAKNVF